MYEMKKKTCVRNEMCTQFQPIRFNVGSDAILLLAQSDITSLVLLPLFDQHIEM